MSLSVSSGSSPCETMAKHITWKYNHILVRRHHRLRWRKEQCLGFEGLSVFTITGSIRLQMGNRPASCCRDQHFQWAICVSNVNAYPRRWGRAQSLEARITKTWKQELPYRPVGGVDEPHALMVSRCVRLTPGSVSYM